MQDGINKINIKDVRSMKVEVSEKDISDGRTQVTRKNNSELSLKESNLQLSMYTPTRANVSNFPHTTRIQ